MKPKGDPLTGNRIKFTASKFALYVLIISIKNWYDSTVSTRSWYVSIFLEKNLICLGPCSTEKENFQPKQVIVRVCATVLEQEKKLI